MNTHEIVNQAISYIMEHIGEEITIEDVADYCHFSKFYFSRIFKEETGESIYAFIKRLKMEQSAFRLKVEPKRTITDIGFDYGYCPSNYSQAFRKHHNKSPVEFRSYIFNKSKKHPFYQGENIQMDTFEECSKKVTIKNIEDFFVVYERYIGSYANMGKSWSDFLVKYEKYQSKDSLLLERNFDDPSITETNKCIYDICMSVPKDCDLPNTYMITGGKFAVYAYKGYPHQIYGAYQTMFNIWFPHTGYSIDRRYGFDVYRKIDCASMYMELDIYIPIE